jgi:HTH-type transcriptional regulator / antitoxin HipB
MPWLHRLSGSHKFTNDIAIKPSFSLGQRSIPCTRSSFPISPFGPTLYCNRSGATVLTSGPVRCHIKVEPNGGNGMEATRVREIGRAIRARRQELGWSQTTLAKQVRTTRRWISEIENGKPTAEVGLVLEALHVLGVKVRLELPGQARARQGPDAARPGTAELEDVLARHVDPGATPPRPLRFRRARI